MENYDETVEFVKSANEGFFNKFKPKVKSDDAINEVIHPPKLQPIDKKLLVNATFIVPIYPYQSNYMNSNDEKAYKALQGKLRPAVSKAILKVQSISKKYDYTNYATYFNNVFSEFSKSYEWKTIGQIMIDIQKFEYKYGGIELDDYNILTDWSLINTEDYTDAVLYDFDLVSCDQDQFFIFDNIIACLFAAASKKIPNSYANCFADDNAVFTLIIKRNEPVTEGIVGKVIGTTVGAILAGYAILILGISASAKKEDKKKSDSYSSKTGVKNKDEMQKNVKSKKNEISKNIINSFTKLQSNSDFMTKLRQAIAKKLNIDISKIPTKFRPMIDGDEHNILIRFITDNEVQKMFQLNKNNNLTNDEFGYWLNEQLTPTFNKIITSIENSGIPEVNSKLIKLECADHWQECGIYLT